MLMTMIVLSIFSSAMADSEVPAFSFSKAQERFEKTQMKFTPELLKGRWMLVGVSIATPAIQTSLPARPGYYKDGVTNSDGSLRNLLEIRDGQTGKDGAHEFEVTISGIGRSDIIQEHVMKASPDFSVIRFRINGYINKDEVQTHFQYTCRAIWSIYPNDDNMVCEIRMVIPKSESWAPAIMSLRDKPIAYYQFKRQ